MYSISDYTGEYNLVELLLPYTVSVNQYYIFWSEKMWILLERMIYYTLLLLKQQTVNVFSILDSLTSQNGRDEVLSSQILRCLHWDDCLQWLSRFPQTAGQWKDGHGWSMETKEGHTGRGLVSQSWLLQMSRNVKSSIKLYLSCILNHRSLPQRWRLWLRLLCSQGECSPSHTPPPEPLAPCNPLRHSADTQSLKRETQRWRDEFT